MTAPTHCCVQATERFFSVSFRELCRKTPQFHPLVGMMRVSERLARAFRGRKWGITKYGTRRGRRLAKQLVVGPLAPNRHRCARTSRRARACSVLVAGMASLVLPFVLHGAVMRAPTLRPALETMLTLLLAERRVAAARAVPRLPAPSRPTARVRHAGAGAHDPLPRRAASGAGVRDGAYLAAAGLWGQFLVAGIFAAAAAVPIEKLIARPGHPARIGLLLGLAPLAAAALGGLLTNALGLDLSGHGAATAEAVLVVLVAGDHRTPDLRGHRACPRAPPTGPTGSSRCWRSLPCSWPAPACAT